MVGRLYFQGDKRRGKNNFSRYFTGIFVLMFCKIKFLPSPSWRSNPTKEEDKNNHEKPE